MRMELHDKGLVLSAPEIPGGPIFSVLPEKIGEKRDTGVRFGACCGCDFRVYLKTHDVTGSEGFLRCARHFFAGILTYFKEK
jgi:hypothetical protein